MNGDRPPRLLAALSLAVLACGWASLQDWLPIEWVRWPLAAVLLVLSALPIILLWARREPSPLKVLYFSSLLSLPLLGGVFLAARQLASPELAPQLVLALVALGQVAIFFRPWHRSPLGKPAQLTLLGALACGVGLAWLLLRSPGGLALAAPRVLWHAGLATELLGPGALENPFLAGTQWPGAGWLEPGIAALSALLGWAPVLCLGLASALAFASLPIGLYLWGAPLWRESRRCALVPWVALFAGSLYLPGLDHLWPDGPFLLAPWVRFLEPGAGPWVLAWGVAALAAAVHAARHGEAPWSGLCGLSVALVCTLEWRLGLALGGGLALAGLAWPGRPEVRSRFLPVLVVWVLAGVALGRAVSSNQPEWPRDSELEPLVLALVAGPAWLACAGLLLGRWRGAGGPGDEAGRRAILVLTLTTGLGLTLLALLGPEASAHAAWQLASLAFGVTAAGGLVDLWQRRWTWILALPISLALALGAVWGLLGGWGYAEERRQSTAEEPGALLLYPEAQEPDFEAHLAALGSEPPPSVMDRNGALRRLIRWRRDGRDMVRCLTWLRDQASREGDPVLVASPRDAKRDLNRRSVALGLAADLPLWVTEQERLARGSARQAPRLQIISSIYGLQPESGGDPFREFVLTQRPSYWIVEEADRSRTRRNLNSTPAVETRLVRRGAERVFQAGRVEVFRFDPANR